MRTSLTRRRIAIVCVLLTAAAVFGVAGLKSEGTMSYAWITENVEDVPNRDEIIQIGDAMFIGEEHEILRIYRSFDGLAWAEIESPASGHDIWSCSIALFRTSGDKLGIAWEETDPDPDKKPRSIFYWSMLDGNTWSEPEILLSRDVYCTLEDAIMLEDGALLLMWQEPLVQHIEHQGRTVEYTGCRVMYRAYVNNDELLIEQIIEPEDPLSCSIDGISFINDGKRIWSVVEKWKDKNFYYRSWSEDGRNWSSPELFDDSDPHIRQMLLVPHGEIGIIRVENRRNLILQKSSDWENWSEETIFKAENVITRTELTEGKDGVMWGYVKTSGHTFFLHSSQDLREYQKPIVRISRYLTLLCIAAVILYVSSWMWKNNSSTTPENEKDVGSSENKSMMK